MNWNNTMLIRLIQNASNEITVLRTKKPELIDNPLLDDRVQLEQVQLRARLNTIRGKDDTSLLNDIAVAIELGSTKKPIEEGKYRDMDILEFVEYSEKCDIWNELNADIENAYINDENNLPLLSVVYGEKEGRLLLLMQGDHIMRRIGLEENEQLVTPMYHSATFYYFKISSEEIEEFLSEVNFDSLRRRLKSSGYEQFVSNIDTLVLGI